MVDDDNITLTLTYDVESEQWRGTCALLPNFHTQGISLRTARHRLATELKKHHPDKTYIDDIRLPEPEASAHQAYQEDRATCLRLERELPAQRLQLAQRLIRLQINIADVARLLNLSPQQMALQLRAEAHGEVDTPHEHPSAR